MLGLGVLALGSRIPGEFRSTALAVLFGGMYLALAKWRGGPAERPRVRTLVAGLLGGAALQVLPFLPWMGRNPGASLDVGAALVSIRLPAVAGTLLVVLWEEFWFRNPVLGVVRRRRDLPLFALWNGLLFAALHLLNPEFDFGVEGPELIAAGAFLTVAWAVHGSVLLPVALHLGNNLAGRMLDAGLAPHGRAAWGGDQASLLRAALLLVGAAVLLRRCGGPSGPTGSRWEVAGD